MPKPTNVPDELVDLWPETHVEHAIGLVEDEGAHLREIDEPALGEILEPAGGGNEDVGSLEPLGLRAKRHAAVCGGDG